MKYSYRELYDAAPPKTKPPNTTIGLFLLGLCIGAGIGIAVRNASVLPLTGQGFLCLFVGTGIGIFVMLVFDVPPDDPCRRM